MRALADQLVLFLLLIGVVAVVQVADGADYTPGGVHTYSYKAGNVPKDVYQYSIYVPKDYDARKDYPLVFYLHGGGRGRSHPDQGRRNMVSARLTDNKRTTDAGYSRHVPGSFGYILVSPVKPIARWKATTFKRLVDHVKGKVSVDKNRIYVTGFSMGGQGTWRVACGTDGTYNIAAMMPLGAWGCNEVKRGTTPATCKTTKTAVWVQHCPLDHVSKIGEQLTLFNNHLKCGGYGRFTMIPGKGHISRGRNDHEFFGVRMQWMLAQTYGTPFNTIVRLHGGTIAKVVSGKRPFDGDSRSYGFYEPGTVLSITAPAENGGKPFVKWASTKGTFAMASSRSTTYTTGVGDVVVAAIYGMEKSKLSVAGGKASPADPEPGQIVTVTPDANTAERKFSRWTTDSKAIDIGAPAARLLTFVMPSEDLALFAHHVKSSQ